METRVWSEMVGESGEEICNLELERDDLIMVKWIGLRKLKVTWCWGSQGSWGLSGGWGCFVGTVGRYCSDCFIRSGLWAERFYTSYVYNYYFYYLDRAFSFL